MAGLDLGMTILNLFGMADPSSASINEPAFVSQQVAEARRYYLDLKPSPYESLVVVCGGRERMRTDYIVARKDFPYYAIEMVAEGEGQLTLENVHHPLRAGSVFAYGPKTSHRIENCGAVGMKKYYVDFCGRRAKQLVDQTGLMSGKPLQVTALHELVDLFDMLDHDGRDDGAMSQQICTSILQLLMLKIQRLAVGPGANVPRCYDTYQTVRRHIEENFMRLESVAQVAQECGITPIYLSRLFSRFGGGGAYQFLIRKKMNYAAELLLEESMLVKEVAERLGFADAFQFSRAFKRVYGVPPKQLIRQHTGRAEPAE
ncbi:helix-turn-helix transcriptional regulator [Crateriforma conspicua]|uniref:HTH-type transcriptional activator Btr n=1 Tax=Crateriforma conspicua TaxID=2527996 RepID=A0A5C6FNY3_9PLAN|nr:AraC family transcriptional regulator [Crateriforma conspicua]TWU62984.1 HTH-type transcriptional activator Btr [Crateriforma conspicua]